MTVKVFSGEIGQVLSDGHGTKLFKLKEEDRSLVIKVGLSTTFPDMKAGDRVVLSGRVSTAEPLHVEATHIEIDHRYSPAMMAEFLNSRNIAGLGIARARTIVNKLKEKLDLTLLNEPHLLADIPGIERRSIDQIYKNWPHWRTRLPLYNLLRKGGLGPKQIRKVEIITQKPGLGGYDKNPYEIIRARGVTFKSADKIALDYLKFDKNDPKRIRAAIRVAFEEVKKSGLCGMPRTDLISKAKRIARGADIKAIAKQLDSHIDKQYLHSSLRGNSAIIYAKGTYLLEKEIAKNLMDRLEMPVEKIDVSRKIDHISRINGIELAAAQREAIEMVFANRVSIITGGPGVGKTTTLKTILQIAETLRAGVRLAAPTGAAAKRITQTTGREAETIHRLLRVTKSGFWFQKGRELRTDYVLIDEHSMTDINLMESLLSGLHKDTRLIMIGDVDQLPSVGPGRVLADLIASSVIPTTRITYVYRQEKGSDIVDAAHSINEGRMPRLESKPGSDFSFHTCETASEVLDGLVRSVTIDLPKEYGFDPARDIQVICPQNIGKIGTIAVNKVLRRALNPSSIPALEERQKRLGDDLAEKSFHNGDKVIQIRNDYTKEVFNGEIGFVCGRDNNGIIVDFDGSEVHYKYQDQEFNLMLAYAVTVHKSQGTESPAIVMPVHSENDFMLQRNLVYTGITRGKDHVHLIGQPKALKRAVANTKLNERYSRLGHNLVELAQKSPKFAHLDLGIVETPLEEPEGTDIQESYEPVVQENEAMGLFG